MIKKLSPNLRAIITAIETDIYYVDLMELLHWCEEENYLSEFVNNIDLIYYLVSQHNESRYLRPSKQL